MVPAGHESTPQRDDPVQESEAEYEELLEAYQQAGGSLRVLQAARVPRLVVGGSRILGKQETPGVHISTEETEDAVRIRIVVEPMTKLEQPIYLCVGIAESTGSQRLLVEYEIGAEASAEFVAHCTFPAAQEIVHEMESTVHVGARAKLVYDETHYHGPYGGIQVVPKSRIFVDDGGQYFSIFRLLHGRVGRLDLDYEVEAREGAIAEMTTRAYGSENDEINVKEVLRLNGSGARGLTKTRIAVRHQARSRVVTSAEGNAPYTCGHMDCAEIVRDAAVAENIPQVIVTNDQAQITHEAAIGRVNKKELETLMARGLDEDAAVDVIVRGMLG